MNPILKQRIPSCVRKLLTDIRPRDEHHYSEWSDTEPETVIRDGIQLPARGTTNQSDFLTPAVGREEGSAANNAGATAQSSVCGLCLAKPSCYTCPRCNVPYCGLECYRSPNHSVCSEEFYKESVFRELKDMGGTESEGRKKMQDILLRLRGMADQAEGGMESVLKTEEEEEEAKAKERAEVVDLLSRLAEIQSSGEGSAEEIEDILTKLKEFGEEGGDIDVGVNDREELDLADRLSGLDIDALSEEALWDLLSSQEKEKFNSLVKGGDIRALVPVWRPWWETHEEEGRALMEELEVEGSKLEGGDAAGHGGCRTREAAKTEDREGASRSLQEDGGAACSSSCEKKGSESQIVIVGENKVKDSGEAFEHRVTSVTEHGSRKCKGKQRTEAKGRKSTSNVPPVNIKIPPLSSLTAHPSPLVGYGLVNTLFGYTFSLRLFNGDIESDLTQEFCQMVLAVAEALSPGRVFSSLQEALEGGKSAILARGYFDPEDPNAPARAVEAVAHVLTGRSKQDSLTYCLSALSHLCATLSKARASLAKGDGGDMRQKYFLAKKKCEFFQAWVSDNVEQVRRLATGLWREHQKRKDERNSLEVEKSGVEGRRKNTKGRGKGVLIEEIEID